MVQLCPITKPFLEGSSGTKWPFQMPILVGPRSSSAETQKSKNSESLGISIGLLRPLVIAPTMAPEEASPSWTGCVGEILDVYAGHGQIH